MKRTMFQSFAVHRICQALAITFTVAAPFSPSAHGAEYSGFYAAAGLGKAFSAMHGYQAPKAIDIYGGYAWTWLGAEIGYSNMDRFKVSAAKESYIDVKIWRASLRAHYLFNPVVFVDGELGVARWDARAVLVRQQVGREQDLKPMWGAEAGLYVMENVSLGLRWQHYADVAGTDINAALVSIKYWF